MSKSLTEISEILMASSVHLSIIDRPFLAFTNKELIDRYEKIITVINSKDWPMNVNLDNILDDIESELAQRN